jgi:AcrR family transcriptional regulator
MGQHRKVSDDQVFDAAQRAMTRHGPQELTLAKIAAEAGVTAGLLVQRFGSKRNLLLALAGRFAGSAPATFAQLKAAHSGPLAVLRAYAACMADLAPTPDALCRNLAYLQIDLTDEDFRKHLLVNARATREQVETLLRSAVSTGWIRADVDARRLARTILSVIGGSLMSWACYRDGSAEAWILQDLDSVLRPYLRRRVAKTPRKRRGPDRAPLTPL